MSSLKSASSQKDAIQKLSSWINQQFVAAKNARWKQERQWYYNLAFYYGQQNIAFKGGSAALDRSFQMYTPPAPYYRARPVVNLIRPRIRTEMSKLTAQKPNAYIVPASSDDRDLYAANAGEQIWDSIYRFKGVHARLRRAVFWASVTGNGFLKSYWDESATDTDGVPGDICFDVVTPFHLFVPDLSEEDIEAQPWVIHAQLRDAEQMSKLYKKPIAFQKLTTDGAMIEESFLNVMGIQQWEKNKKVLVLEAWIKPGSISLLPQGGMVVLAGNQLVYPESLDQATWPYEHNKYPFAHIGHVHSGKFYRDSIIADMIPLQKEYNRTRGQIIEAKNRMSKPQLVAEQGSIDPTKVTSEPGQIILYRPGFKAPEPLPLQGVPSYVLDELERIKIDMDEISGQHEVSRGGVPVGVSAATAISYLQEQDESKLAYTFDSIEEAMEKVAFLTLNYVKQFWDTNRQVRVTGADGSFDVLAFKGSDLRGNTDIRMEAGSSLPTSRAAKQAFIMDLMKMGFIDPQKGLEVMEIGGVNKIYEQVQTDVRQAQRENLKMAQVTPDLIAQDKAQQQQTWLQGPDGQQAVQNGLVQDGPNGPILMNPVTDPATGSPVADPMTGQPMMQPGEIPTTLIVPVNNWDDHRIHIERHNHYRKGQAFENLPQFAKDLFEQHVQQHVAAIVQGATGALPPELAAGIIQNSNNPEAIKETQQQANPSVPGSQL